MNHMTYRADIDGLRAIAILSVVGYHAFPEAIPGGFIGVDIFFVISGFLITSIILKNHAQGRFSLAEFYARRVKRIFPALLLVIASSWMFGWLVLLPDEFSQLGKHIAAGIGFVSNFVLWNEAGYFNTASATKPLLHLWSLGIEEQYYIFWPLLIGLFYGRKLSFIILVCTIALLSFAANILTLQYDAAVSAFYLPSNRFWELMIGGMLAYATLHKYGGNGVRWLPANVRSMAGCVLIALGIGLIDNDSSFPGWWALLPTVGSFLIISAPGSAINRRLLANRALVYIGLISYPLYLWHWPLLSFGHILDLTDSTSRLIAIAAALMLAVLSYELLEKPIKRARQRPTVRVLAAMAIGLLLLGISTAGGKPPPRNNTSGLALSSVAVGDWDYPGRLRPFQANGIELLIQRGDPQKVLFYGDSHMEQYAPRIVELINHDPYTNKSAVFATRSGCPPIPNVYEDHHPECSPEFKQAVLEYALSEQIDSVVIATFFAYLIERDKPAAGGFRYYYLEDDHKIYYDQGGARLALQAFEQMIARIARHKKVFLLIDNPSGSGFDPKTFFSGSRLQGIVDKRVALQPYDLTQQAVRQSLIGIAERTGAIIIDSTEHFCSENRCRAILEDGTPIYKDSGHIRPFYMKQFVDYIDVTIRKDAAAK